MNDKTPMLVIGSRGNDGVELPLELAELCAELRASERVGDTPGSLQGIWATKVGSSNDGETIWEVTVNYRMRFQR